MSNEASNDSGNNFVTNENGEGGGDGYEEYNPPADRFLTAQIWWIASELVRRHPHLRFNDAGHNLTGNGGRGRSRKMNRDTRWFSCIAHRRQGPNYRTHRKQYARPNQ